MVKPGYERSVEGGLHPRRVCLDGLAGEGLGRRHVHAARRLAEEPFVNACYPAGRSTPKDAGSLGHGVDRRCDTEAIARPVERDARRERSLDLRSGDWPRAGRSAVKDRARAAHLRLSAQEGEVVVDAMPAHSEGHHAGCAAIRRQNAETDVDSASAGWQRYWSSKQQPTAPVPVRREGSAELADLQGRSGCGADHNAGLRWMHPEQDSRRHEEEVPENDL